MIRSFCNEDLFDVMKIWWESNLDAHSFISENYWKSNFHIAEKLIKEAEIYVYENESGVVGFIGLNDNYIAGLFVKKCKRSQGIGRQLLNFVKSIKKDLILTVYEKNMAAVRFYKREGFNIRELHMDEETQEKEYVMFYQR